MQFNNISCSADVKIIECINPRKDLWAVRWGLSEDPERGTVIQQAIVTGRPDVDSIRSAIASHIDAEITDQIENSFYWNEKQIRLTDTAQRNFLFAVFSIDHSGEIDTTPFAGILKSSDPTEASTEIRDMVNAMWQHIKECRATGIARKAAIDYEAYRS